MKAADFDYEKPETLDAALALLNDPATDSVALAGGQSLVPMMNFRMAQPERLVDLAGIPSLKGIRQTADAVIVGAMTRYVDLQASDVVAEHLPLIPKALPHIAHSAIRNRGTVGGSVALADPAAEMPALLLALDGEVLIDGPGGTRRVPADDFFIGLYETALAAGELVTAIEFPKAQPGDRFGFYEIARRHGDYAMAGVAVSAARSRSPRVVFFGVSDRAVRAREAETVLAEGGIENLAARHTACRSLGGIAFSSDLNAEAATKRHLAGVVLKRALAGLSEEIER